MVNLVNLLVAQHVITKIAGDGLIKQANQEAEAARSQVVTTQATADRALAQTSQPADTPTSPASDDDVKVNYVPDVVKNQIGDEVTERVLKKAHDEKWAATDPLPDWVHRFHVTGDIRVRYEGDMYPDGNAVGNFTNFNAINTSASGLNANAGAPFAPLPQFNVDQDRNRFRLRARIGSEVDLDDGFTVGLRLGTGADNSPVTENQTLGGVGGVTGGQGGNFGKYAVWLDRAFLKYEMGNPLEKDFAVTIGRFNNPFLSTSMIFSEDLGFDGAVAQAKYKVAEGVTPFLTAGGFPVFNTDLNFSSTQSAKFSSEDKYLYAVQAGTNWTINKDFSLKVAAAFYDFQNIEGKVSSAIPVASVNDVGNTDDSRPAFAQNGNTYIALRDFEDPAPGVNLENQFYGLATPFREAAVTGQLDFSRFDPVHVSLIAEFVNNVAFDRNSIINNGPATNPGPQNNTSVTGAPKSFYGGNSGYNVRLTVGKPVLQRLWDWNINLTYRYVESDSTVDGFTDSDFGGSLAGTNIKGYIIAGTLALTPRVWTSLRFLSSDSLAGPAYHSDVIQFDVNAKF